LELLLMDTALALWGLCDQARREPGSTEYFAVAPNPMVDLSGTASIGVRVTRVGDAVLCTWVPGWHVVGEEEDHRLTSATSTPVSDSHGIGDAPQPVPVGRRGLRKDLGQRARDRLRRRLRPTAGGRGGSGRPGIDPLSRHIGQLLVVFGGWGRPGRRFRGPRGAPPTEAAARLIVRSRQSAARGDGNGAGSPPPHRIQHIVAD
jgi:hypothetical protein